MDCGDRDGPHPGKLAEDSLSPPGQLSGLCKVDDGPDLTDIGPRDKRPALLFAASDHQGTDSFIRGNPIKHTVEIIEDRLAELVHLFPRQVENENGNPILRRLKPPGPAS